MNCTQAQALLAAYHELKNRKIDTLELDVHLEGCASCRQVLARSTFVSEQLRSLAAIETPPDMHAKLMSALAAEHVRFIEQSKPGTISTPEFLQPYLQEHAQSTSSKDLLTAFSTADTGPLPIIRTSHKRRSHFQMSQFAVLGLAAMFLMVLMMGGLTSLLLLAHNNLPSVLNSRPNISIIQPSNVEQATYTTNTSYQHVVSAVADRSSIYYTAYQNGDENSWMLEQLDRTSQKNLSTPLLAAPSKNPLIVLGSSNGWLVWLEFDTAKPLAHGNIRGLHSSLRSWSLHSIAVSPLDAQIPGEYAVPNTLLSGTFDKDTAPSWIYTPIHGIWFISNSLLVATTDENGISHLYRYQLGSGIHSAPIEIARATSGHILTSPTANNDGSQIYWSDEWRTDDGVLHSNIWTQQVYDAARPTHGRWLAHKLTVKQLFLSDSMSFRPQVVDDTLFLLSTAPMTDATSAINQTPIATVNPAPTTSPATPTTSRIDSSIYDAPLDESVRGTVLMFSLDGAPNTAPNPVSSLGQASALQAGTDFALWQDSKGYGMYDVKTSDVNVGSVLDGARFVAINGDTAAWVENTTTSSGTSNGTGQSVTIMAFNWPQ